MFDWADQNVSCSQNVGTPTSEVTVSVPVKDKVKDIMRNAVCKVTLEISAAMFK
jgi:hypothetical protein